MNFINIGESITKLSEKLKASEPGIPWAKYKGFRNIVAHNYFGVDAEEVWQIIHTSIPQLEANPAVDHFDIDLLGPQGTHFVGKRFQFFVGSVGGVG